MKARDLMKSNVYRVNDSDTLSVAQQAMLWMEVRHLPVMHDGEVVGVLSERDLLRHRAAGRPLTERVSMAMSSPVRTAHPDDPVRELLERMAEARIGCLPIMEGGEMVGIISRTDLLACQFDEVVDDGEPEPRITAADVMTSDPQTIGADDALGLAVAAIVELRVRNLPVTQSDGVLVGMLSETAIRTAVGEPRHALSTPSACADTLHRPVRHIMRHDPPSVFADTAVSEVMKTLATSRMGAIAVVDARHRVIGIISTVDVLHMMSRVVR